MPRAKLISPITKESLGKRVAAYCRVSTNYADQKTSYATQIRVYQKMINDNPDWTLVDIFADEGISGMRAENRPEFQRMISVCEHGEIDIILVKSLSHFARNVKEALEYTRKLRRAGVSVIFEKESINTTSMGDEMLLSTFSAIAEEESQSISQNLRHSITKRMELGEFIDSNAPYGFRLTDKRLEVYEPEAEVVRMIYDMYLSGQSTSEIAKALTEKRVPTKDGRERWRSARIGYILTNERYAGDSRYQKTFRSATVPFRQSKNRGEADMFYASMTHTGIIDRETFDRVQELYDSFESKITGMASEVRKLESLIQAIDAPLEEFDGKLFNEIVVGMTINNMDELTITLIGGLEFTEII